MRQKTKALAQHCSKYSRTLGRQTTRRHYYSCSLVAARAYTSRDRFREFTALEPSTITAHIAPFWHAHITTI